MPWRAAGVPMLREQFVHLVRSQRVSVSEACRRFGVSRDTGHRWLRRFDADPDAPLADASRRPRSSPDRTPEHIERLIAEAREQYRWGARKIHALLARRGVRVPSVRTVHQILRRLELVSNEHADPAPRSDSSGLRPTNSGRSITSAPSRSRARHATSSPFWTTTHAISWPFGPSPTAPSPPPSRSSGT